MRPATDPPFDSEIPSRLSHATAPPSGRIATAVKQRLARLSPSARAC